MVNDTCEQVCKTLTKINDTLIRTFVERLTDVLGNINTSIEISGKVDERLIDEIKDIRKDIENLYDAIRYTDHSSEVKKLLDSIKINTAFTRESDRPKIVDFVQRISIAIANWTPEEKNAVIDFVGNTGRSLVAIKKKLNKVYYIIVFAGVMTILSQSGAPNWLFNILKSIF